MGQGYPSSPSYRLVQFDILYEFCRNLGDTPDYANWEPIVGSAAGFGCVYGPPSNRTGGPLFEMQATCDYNPAKVTPGYHFDCYLQDNGQSSVEFPNQYNQADYEVQFETPVNGKWWFVSESSVAPQVTNSGSPFFVPSGEGP